MIDLFTGEFLLHPAPLEYSGRTCSHRCAYCFSSIRNKNISAKFKQTLSFFENINSGRTLMKELFRRGYSICISNRTDPLSDSNIDDSLILADILRGRPNGIFLQTKGGRRQYELLDKLSPAKDFIYITITCATDAKAKIIEPGAPLTSERLEFAAECARRGFLTCLAFNPYVEEWQTHAQTRQMIDRAKSFGVNMFIFQALHLSSREIKTFEPWRMKHFDGLDFEAEFKDHKGQRYMQGIVSELREDASVDVVSFGMPWGTRFIERVRAKLGKCFPSNYDFFNFVERNKKDFYTFGDYYENITGHSDLRTLFEEPFKEAGKYLFATARNVWKSSPRAQGCETFKELLRVVWNDARVNSSPQRNFMFKGFDAISEGGDIFLKRKEVNEDD